MAGISSNRKSATLRTDSLADLGVTMKDINLVCNTCGADFMLPVPWESGNFPRNWWECPGNGCNKGAARKPAA